jgi:putative copper export protein
MLPVTWTTIRLFLHVLAATVWVGGQLTLAGLVPGLRELSDEAPRTVARQFNRIAWPAFAVLVFTGIWNVAAVAGQTHTSGYTVTLFFKVAIVALSGASAALHAQAKSRVLLALMGALSGLTALLALFLGVLLAG